MDKYSQVRYWIDELPKRGKTTFSLKEAENQFPDKPVASVRSALARLSDAGKIRSVWKGFYAISLPEYGMQGVAPPIDYIDQLTRYIGTNYYVALLTAASYNGASRHAPQIFYVICDSNLHPKNKYELRIEPIYKKTMPRNYITEINSRTASVKISTPELTAIDMIVYIKRVGGINQVTTVIAELAESMDFNKINTDFFDGVSVAAIQRLGYILDEEINEKEIAESLYNKTKQAGIRFKMIPLVIDKANQFDVLNRNKKWGIIVNYKIESDL